eukprot:c16408_g1_i1 orf=820-1059(+)
MKFSTGNQLILACIWLLVYYSFPVSKVQFLVPVYAFGLHANGLQISLTSVKFSPKLQPVHIVLITFIYSGADALPTIYI